MPRRSSFKGERIPHLRGGTAIGTAGGSQLANPKQITEHQAMENLVDAAPFIGDGALSAPLRLCMEDRMLLAAATGVATYARALRTAQQQLSSDTVVLSGGPNGHPLASSGGWRGSIARAIRALPGRRQKPDVFDAENLVAPDIFRLAQAHFTIHGRLLPVLIPGPPGLMHWSYPLPIYAVGWHNLYTIHDMIPLTNPDLTPINARRHERVLAKIADAADALVTVSESSSSDVVRHLAYDAGRVVNCSQPVDVPAPPLSPGDLPKPLQAGRYFIVCGYVEPRKNISRLLQAYAQSGTVMPLVLAGPKGWKEDAIGIAADGVRIIRLPYQSREAMITLLANARALLMPSLAEGFGLPVAEAMALGTPVVTSNHGALAETAGDAALLVDACDTSAISAAIRRIDRDDALRDALILAGRRQFAVRFTTQAFAERLGALYQRVQREGK